MKRRYCEFIFDIDETTKPHLRSVYQLIKFGNWGKNIEDLAMELIYDEVRKVDRVRISGWCFKSKWDKFYNNIIKDNCFDYLFKD